MNRWKEYTLSEITDFIDYWGKTPNKVNSGIPLITAKIVKNGKIEEPSEFISFEDYPKYSLRELMQSLRMTGARLEVRREVLVSLEPNGLWEC